jgi:hypothetical protein
LHAERPPNEARALRLVSATLARRTGAEKYGDANTLCILGNSGAQNDPASIGEEID